MRGVSDIANSILSNGGIELSTGKLRLQHREGFVIALIYSDLPSVSRL